PQAHNAVPLMAPIHPNGAAYDHASVASLATSPAPSSAAAGSARAHVSSPAYYGTR
ncbi:hypothetical protein H4R23_004759, partial [Coemansia sp. Cherry 401B]